MGEPKKREGGEMSGTIGMATRYQIREGRRRAGGGAAAAAGVLAWPDLIYDLQDSVVNETLAQIGTNWATQAPGNRAPSRPISLSLDCILIKEGIVDSVPFEGFSFGIATRGGHLEDPSSTPPCGNY